MKAITVMMGSIILTCAGTTVACLSYGHAALSPTSQLFGKTLIAGTNPNEYAITFDDGPNEPYTMQILDVLARYQAQATFFVIGTFAKQRPEIVRAIAQAGHLVGNHTMTHPMLLRTPANVVMAELSTCKCLLEDLLGKPVEYFRPPYGARRPAVLRIAQDLGMATVMWNTVGYDWKPAPAASILHYVRRGMRRNQSLKRSHNVLLHDGSNLGIGADRAHTVEATALLLATLCGRTDIHFVTPAVWRERNR